MAARIPERPVHPILIALIAASAFFMQFLDGTVFTTALPQMAISFGTSPIQVSIGITAYILTAAAFIPISGWLADRFGSRTVFCGAIAVFVAGSVLCGISTTLPMFTAARVIQGIGGAVMAPVGQLVVIRDVPKHELVRSITLMTVPGLLAPVIGPPLGGFITTYASWHWIFFLNVPIGCLGIVMVLRFIGNHFGETRPPLDLVGFALTGLALIFLMSGLDLASRRDVSLPIAAVLMAVGIGVGLVAVAHARRAAFPMLDLAPFDSRTFALTSSAGSLFRIAAGATPFLLPIMLQVGFGLTAFAAGVLLLMLAGCDLAMKAVVRRIFRQFGFRTVLVSNGLLVALAIASCATLSPQSPLVVLLAILGINGAVRSLQFTGVNTLAFAEIPQSKMSVATTMNVMIQQLSMGNGVALGAIVLRLLSSARHPASDVVTIGDFHLAFLIVGGLACVAAIGFLRLDPDAGAEVSGHRQVIATSG